MSIVGPTHTRTKRAAPRRSRPATRRHAPRLWLEQLEDRTLLSAGASMFDATVLPLNNPAAPFQIVHQAFFQIEITEPGNLTAEIDAGGLPTSLTLYDAQGTPIVQSNGQSAENRNPSITQGLISNGGPTDYYLKVANLGVVQTRLDFMTALFTPSDSVLQRVPLQGRPRVLVTGDFNGDGRADLATSAEVANGVTVLLNNGDGTFQKVQAGPFDAGINIEALAVGYFNADAYLDLVAANVGTDGVSVLLGDGHGGFEALPTLKVPGGSSLAVGDFTGDGNFDVAYDYPGAVLVSGSGTVTVPGAVTVLEGNGDGTFQTPRSTAVPANSLGLVTGDFNGDGHLDVATADHDNSQVTVLLGIGDGTFRAGCSSDTGLAPRTLVSGDFNGDSRLDLATANEVGENVTVLWGDGRGSFRTAGVYPVGGKPAKLIAADFNGDGRPDLATANFLSNRLSVLLSNTAHTFQDAVSYAVDSGPGSLAAGDFNGDARIDLAVASDGFGEIELLLGNGDGTFPPVQSPNATGHDPEAMVAADFNGDGRQDLAVANAQSNNVTVLLGQGDGTFQSSPNVDVGAGPTDLLAGDFNGDGRLDLAVADGADDLTLLLGQGDGTFKQAATYHLPGIPASLAAGFFDGDRFLDVAVAIEVGIDPSIDPFGGVLMMRGNGDGTFRVGGFFSAGHRAGALAAADFNGDGRLDLAVAGSSSFDVTILMGDGRGGFGDSSVYAIAGDPLDVQQNEVSIPAALVVGDFDGDTNLDLAVASQSYYYGNVTPLLNNGHGIFHYGPTSTVPGFPRALIAGDFNGDDRLDLGAAGPPNPNNLSENNVALLLGNGDGSFQSVVVSQSGNVPNAAAAADFNRDGRLDLAIADFGTSSVTVLLGTGTAAFASPALAPSPLQSTPLVANFTGGPAPDSVVLTATGQILFRRSLADSPGAFAPPVVINSQPEFAARDLALVRSAGKTVYLAALDASLFAVSTDPSAARVPRVTLYRLGPDGSFRILLSLDLPAGSLPSNIASADLAGDGLGDLVLSAAATGQVFVVLQTAPGVFRLAPALVVGGNPSVIDLVDVDGDNRADIVVADRFSGQVSVLLNQGGGVFASEDRFRAGTGLYGLATINGISVVQSLEGTSGVVAGEFDGQPGTDLVVINSGTERFGLLPGDGFGGFLNPQTALTVYTGTAPSAIVMGHFISGDDGLDLAVLSKDGDSVSIYCSDGQGGFTLIDTAGAGNQPTGLSVADVTRPGGGGPDGIQDLLVGNAFGDLLILAGKGDGTFAEYRRVGQTVSLAVTSSPGTGQATFYFSDQGNDQLAYATAALGASMVANPTVFQNRGTGIESPGPQAVVSVAGTQYLVVVNSGANSLLIYTLGPDGAPIASSKQTYFTGTDPVSLTITTPANSLNRDTLPDVVVANQGSNDVSIFLGHVDPATNTWTLAYRPRQSSGGVGPTSVAVADVNGGLPDLVVSNGQSNKIGVLLSQGDGYFSNQSALLDTGNNPEEVFVGQFDGQGGLDLVTINAGSNDVTMIEDFMAAPVTSTIFSGGTLPLAGAVVEVNGVIELLVANAGNGVLEVLQFTSTGLEVVATLDTSAPNLADLALVVVGNVVQVYGTDAGSEVAFLLATLGPPPPVPDFLPPSPGFAEGFELSGSGTPNADIGGSSLSALTSGTISEAGPTAQVIAAVFSTTLAATSDSAPDAPPPLDSPGSRTTGEGPTSGNAAGILLLNLRDPRESSSAENRAEEPEQADDPVPEMQEEATSNDLGHSSAVETGARTADQRMLDHYWQTMGVEQLSGRAAVESPPTNGRSARHLAAPIAIELTPRQRVVAIQLPAPDACALGESPPDLAAPDSRPATASFAAAVCTLPLLASHWLDAMRRIPSRLKTLLRRAGN